MFFFSFETLCKKLYFHENLNNQSNYALFQIIYVLIATSGKTRMTLGGFSQNNAGRAGMFNLSITSYLQLRTSLALVCYLFVRVNINCAETKSVTKKG